MKKSLKITIFLLLTSFLGQANAGGPFSFLGKAILGVAGTGVFLATASQRYDSELNLPKMVKGTDFSLESGAELVEGIATSVSEPVVATVSSAVAGLEPTVAQAENVSVGVGRAVINALAQMPGATAVAVGAAVAALTLPFLVSKGLDQESIDDETVANVRCYKCWPKVESSVKLKRRAEIAACSIGAGLLSAAFTYCGLKWCVA